MWILGLKGLSVHRSPSIIMVFVSVKELSGSV